MEKTVYEGSGAMFEEDIMVEESIKKEVEIINKKLENNLNGGVEAGVENIDDLKPKTITYCRIASFQKQAFSDFVIAYDAYIDKYVRYTNIIPDCQIQNKMAKSLY